MIYFGVNFLFAMHFIAFLLSSISSIYEWTRKFVDIVGVAWETKMADDRETPTMKPNHKNENEWKQQAFKDERRTVLCRHLMDIFGLANFAISLV